MNQYEWRKAVSKSNMSSGARNICRVYADYSKFDLDQDNTVQVGLASIQRDANLTFKTAKKYQDEAVEAGYLFDTGILNQYNTTTLELRCPEVVPTKQIKEISETQKANLAKSPYRSTSGKSPLVTGSTSQVSSGERAEVLVENGKLVVENVPVSSGDSPYEHNYNIEEHREEHTSTPKVVDVEDSTVSRLEEDESSTGKAGTESTTSSNSLISDKSQRTVVEDSLSLNTRNPSDSSNVETTEASPNKENLQTPPTLVVEKFTKAIIDGDIRSEIVRAFNDYKSANRDALDSTQWIRAQTLVTNGMWQSEITDPELRVKTAVQSAGKRK